MTRGVASDKKLIKVKEQEKIQQPRKNDGTGKARPKTKAQNVTSVTNMAISQKSASTVTKLGGSMEQMHPFFSCGRPGSKENEGCAFRKVICFCVVHLSIGKLSC